ncbi:golgin IMH1 [Gossypium australe]|uniref:Golgin IMH1 n=1 Tax=Gossypium australe TaxID=47621 RepID=A0A5B6WAB4_9ROSI|nr:golgin IMH1 [Gossypium australe]
MLKFVIDFREPKNDDLGCGPVFRKLFFFKSFSSNDDIHVDFSPSANKQVYWENTSENGFDDQHGGNEAKHSLCSPKHLSGKSQKQISDSLSFSNDSCLQRSGSFSSATFIVDDLNKLSNVNQHQQYDHSLWMAHNLEKKSKTKLCEEAAIGFEKTCSSVSLRLHYDSSGSFSSCSSNVSSKVIDCYINEERQPERCKCRDCSKRNIGNGGGRLLPRVRYASPSSPTVTSDDKKNVIGRLSQTHAIPISSSKEFDCCIPITTEDVYDGCLNRCPDFSSLDFAFETVEDTDKELQRRSKEAEERILFLSEALEKESFLRDSEFAVSSLIQTVRHLMEEKINLTLEVSELLRSRIANRACAREELRMVRAEFELQTKKIEKEKHEIKLGLEKELDRRLSDWSLRLEKYQSEEQRLRERARELAEHNVSLQREVSTFNEKETRNRSIMTYSAEQLKSLSMKVENLSNENEDLRKNLSQLRENYRAETEDQDCIRRSFKEKDKDEQEKMIEGLRQGYHDEIDKKKSGEKNEDKVKKLQMEQIRLTGVELALRRELESLNGTTNDIGALTFKLDKEIRNRICCLQDQGLSMLNESTHLSSKLIEFIKGKASHNQLRVTQQGLDG